MTVQFTSREFNQQAARARRATRDGLVFITNRGEAEQVLMSMQEYRRLSATRLTIGELLSNPDVAEIDLELSPRSAPEPLVDPFGDDDD